VGIAFVVDLFALATVGLLGCGFMLYALSRWMLETKHKYRGTGFCSTILVNRLTVSERRPFTGARPYSETATGDENPDELGV
jgi:hypothetical protein